MSTIITSEDISKLSLSLNAFQSELVTVGRTVTNPFFKAKYADLTSIMLESQPILTKHELSVSQFPDTTPDNQSALTTILMHTSGQFIRATVPLPVSRITVTTKREKGKDHNGKDIPEKITSEDGYDPQEFGRAITYMRRYGYAAVLQIVIDEDDDGNKSSRRQQEKLPEPIPSNPETVQKIKDIWKENGGTEEQLDAWVRKNNNDVALDVLSGDRQLGMLQFLSAKKAEREAKAKENLDKVAGEAPATQSTESEPGKKS